jgi:hypothetical protein
MKLNICFSGQPYTNIECVESFKKNFLQPEYFCVSHFWWDESYLNKCYKMHYSFKYENKNNVKDLINEFMIQNYKLEKNKIYNLNFVNCLNLKTWEGMSKEYHRMMVPILLYGVYSQLDSICSSVKEIKKDCDIIVRTRPDIVYTKSLKNIIDSLPFNDKTVYIQSSMEGGHLYAGEPANRPCDWFYMGERETLKKFVNTLKNSFENKFKNGVIHLRDFFQQIADENNIKLELIDFGCVIHKQTSLFDSKYKNNINVYNEDFKDGKIKTPNLWPYWISNIDFEHFQKINFCE